MIRSVSAMKSSTRPPPSSPLNMGSLGWGIHGAWSRMLPPGVSGAAIIARCCLLSGSCPLTPRVTGGGQSIQTHDKCFTICFSHGDSTWQHDELVETHSALMHTDGMLFQDGYHWLHSPVIYAGGWTARTALSCEICRLSKAFQTAILFYFELLIGPKLKKY